MRAAGVSHCVALQQRPRMRPRRVTAPLPACRAPDQFCAPVVVGPARACSLVRWACCPCGWRGGVVIADFESVGVLVLVCCPLVPRTLCACVSGIFLPLLTVAGSFGRLFGELVAPFSSDPFEPGVYAVVACSAMIAGATHTISPCIVMIEITAQASGGSGGRGLVRTCAVTARGSRSWRLAGCVF